MTTSTLDLRLSAGLVAAAPAPELTDDQRAVVAHASGPLLVLGAPGTGKTTVLQECVVGRAASGEDPARMLVLTQTRPAARRLRAALARRLTGVAAPAVMTFPALCRQIVSRYGSEVERRMGAERLLRAAEQDAMLRDALDGWGAQRWPEHLRAAVGTQDFVDQLRAIFQRARELGMDPADLSRAGRRAHRPEWIVAGEFFEEYLQLLDLREAIDHGELVHRARLIARDRDLGRAARAAYVRAFVDEYQDVDDVEAALLRDLFGRGGSVTAFGDPDSAIYAFRGTASRALSRFVADFASATVDADVRTLTRGHRMGPALSEAVGRIADRLPVVPALSAWRAPRPGAEHGRVTAAVCESDSAQAEHVAAVLRRAHLDDGLSWSAMGVVVRSGHQSLARLARALVSSGVPVAAAGSEVPLSEEAAIRPLLLALAVAAQLRPLDAETAEELVASPLCGVNAVDRRSLTQSLRATGQAPGDSWWTAVLESPERLDVLDEAHAGAVAAVREFGQTLRDVGRGLARGASAHQALWQLWSTTDWPERLRRAAVAGGDRAPAAHHDLDAVCALFDLARDLAGQHQPGPGALLGAVAAQRIPVVLAEADGRRRDAVDLVTVHRSQGLEWDLVVVADVQEGLWPSVRRRSTLLDADRLLPDGIAEAAPVATRVADERRLFHVACSRARRELVVLAVDDEEQRPSRFLDELGVEVQRWEGRPRRSRTLDGHVAELRRTAEAAESAPPLRQAAVEELARLADATDDRGRPVAPLADPERWWGVLEPSVRAEAVAPATEPILLSPSNLQALLACPRRWFLAQQARVSEPGPAEASVGTLVHALVESAAREAWSAEELRRQLDAAWPELTFPAAWQARSKRAQAEAMIERYVCWAAARDAELVGVEVPFDVTIPVGGDAVRLRGAVDRLERVAGGLRVVDFKTGHQVPSAGAVASLPQFGAYQLAVEAGGFQDVVPERSAQGAVGVYLAHEARGRAGERLQPSLTDHPWPDPESATQEPSWMHEQLAQAVRIVRAGEFPARICADCRYCAFTSACPAQAAGRQLEV